MKNTIRSHLLITLIFISTLFFNVVKAEDSPEAVNENEKLIQVKTHKKNTLKEKEKLNTQNLVVGKEVELIKSEIVLLEQDLLAEEAYIKTAREDADHAKKNLDELKQKKTATQDAISKLRKEKSSLKETYLKTNAKSLLEEKQLKEKLAELEKQERLIQEERMRLDKDLEKLQKDIKQKQSQSETQASSLLKAQELLKKVQTNLAESKEQKDKLLEAISKSVEEKNKLNETLANTSKEITNTKAEIARHKINSELAKKNYNETNLIYKATSKEATRLKDENKQEEVNLKKTEDEVKDLQGLIKAGQEVIERAKKENEILLKRNRKVQLDKPLLQAQLAILRTQYKALMDKNQALRQKL